VQLLNIISTNISQQLYVHIYLETQCKDKRDVNITFKIFPIHIHTHNTHKDKSTHTNTTHLQREKCLTCNEIFLVYFIPYTYNLV